MDNYELRADVEYVRQGEAYPGQPWEEFIRFAEDHASSDPDFGPLFFRDTARVGRYVRSLEEQYQALHLAAEAVFRSGYEAPSGMRGRYVNGSDMDALGAVLYPAKEHDANGEGG